MNEVATADYELLLAQDTRWALMEGSRHFDEKSAVFEALRRIARRLDAIGVSYAVVGGMALFQHGYRRFTEDVDILVTPKGLKTIHDELEGLGYLPPHRNSRNLRDTELGVRIEFLIAGAFPGDGKPKPVAFPEPETVGIDIDGIRFLNLSSLIELKLASGMTSPGRMRDLSDVMELIRSCDLKESYADRLDPFVRDRFVELCRQAQTRFIFVVRDAAVTSDVIDIENLADQLPDKTDRLHEMRDAGVWLDNAVDGSATLVTTDPEVAQRFAMVDESEYWNPDDQP